MVQHRIGGQSGSVKIGGTTVLGVRLWSAREVMDVEDATGMDSAGWHEEKSTLKQLRDIRIQCFRDTQAGGTPPEIWSTDQVTFELSEGTGGQKYTGTMQLHGIPRSVPVGGLIEYTLEGNSTGEVTLAAA